MKTIVSPFLACALFLAFAGCGDNKTKQKLVGTSLYDSNGIVTDTSGGTGATLPATPTASAAGMAQNSASMMSGVITAGGTPINFLGTTIQLLAPGRSSGAERKALSRDSEYFFDFSDFYPGLKVQFNDEYKVAYSSIVVTAPWIRVKFTTQFSGYGTLAGDFWGHLSVSPKTLSGTISANDPLGGTFTATLNNITYQMITSNVGAPTGGSLAITGSSGYQGALTFASAGGNYTCTGNITSQSATVASVALTFDTPAKKYTGSYTDSTGTYTLQ